MKKDFSEHISESKTRYRKNRAKMSFEEKIQIIIELQKIDAEMRKKNRSGLKPEHHQIWVID